MNKNLIIIFSLVLINASLQSSLQEEQQSSKKAKISDLQEPLKSIESEESSALQYTPIKIVGKGTFCLYEKRYEFLSNEQGDDNLFFSYKKQSWTPVRLHKLDGACNTYLLQTSGNSFDPVLYCVAKLNSDKKFNPASRIHSGKDFKNKTTWNINMLDRNDDSIE